MSPAGRWADAQRQTWVKDVVARGYADVRFFYGIGDQAKTYCPHSDEVALNVPDDYRGIPLKVQAIMRWAAEHCYDVTAKCDDDVYVIPERFPYLSCEMSEYTGRFRTPHGKVYPVHFASGFFYWLRNRAMQTVADTPWNGDWMDERFVATALARRGMFGTHDADSYKSTIPHLAAHNTVRVSSSSGDPAIEKSYSTHYVSPALSERKQEKLQEKLNRVPHPVVFEILRDAQVLGVRLWRWARDHSYLMEAEQPLCLACAGFGDLEFLAAGDVALTRRATKHSARNAVVVRFSRTRKRYERQGVLVETSALERPSGNARKMRMNGRRDARARPCDDAKKTASWWLAWRNKSGFCSPAARLMNSLQSPNTPPPGEAGELGGRGRAGIWRSAH